MTVRERFEQKVDRRGDDECWPWKGAIGGRGYGNFGMDGKTVAAHRAAFYFANGDWPNVACHTCDNKNCVNPAHLYNGDKSSNQRDYYQRSPRAEQHRNVTSALLSERNRKHPRPVQYCTVEGCNQRRAGRGLCMKHYDDARRGRSGTWQGGPCQ